MMEEEAAKGTVTSLSSVFSAEEAHKASKRVVDTIVERRNQLNQLKDFVMDNANLVNLVQKLPEQLHHDIIVPFGKAAFFPGRLIHTNELLVLLGEGYYAERTSKQTVEILKRRGKALDSQVESLNAVMQDLKAEASFFDATAAEAAGGLLEIREDCVEETYNEKAPIAGIPKPDSPSFPEADNIEAGVDDEEFNRILSIMDKLEKDEEEAENATENDQDEQNESELSHRLTQHSTNHEVKSSEHKAHQVSAPPEHSKVESTREDSSNNYFLQGSSYQLNFEGSKVHPVCKDESSDGRNPAFKASSFIDKASKLPEKKENAHAAPGSENEGSVQTSEPGSMSSKAFTGSIIEHTRNINMNATEQTATRSSKPVSRFKMQRR